jgi:hypothetical protein
MVRHGLLLAALATGGAASAQGALPVAIDAFTRENIEACRGAGGSPSLQGLDFPGADRTAEVHVPYVTEADLNGDGMPDYVTDLAGLECAGAWSYFCGSAGCPVTVWLSGPAGHSVAWGGSAQAWRLEGAEVVLSLHGQLCSPPRVGAEGCEVRMDFAGRSGAAEAVESGTAVAAAVPPATSLRPRERPATPRAVTPAPPDAVSPEPGPAAPAPRSAAGWATGQLPDRSGWFAGVRDDGAGRRLDWICAKGRGSFLALSPYAGGPRIAIDVGGRVQEFDVEVANGAAYAPVDLTSGIFLHIVSGPSVTVSEPGGDSLGIFSMDGAPLAIGQAEGRCRA